MIEKGVMYFFTGLAGAGKTTIGGLFYEHLKAVKPDAILLDGDKQRSIVGQKIATPADMVSAPTDAGYFQQDDDRLYSTEARKRGALETAAFCRELVNSGKDVVLCTISMYKEVRSWYRENVEKYVEIYICVKRETLYQRNQKGLYSPGRRNVVGVDLPWDEPRTPDIVIHNDGQQTPEEIVRDLIQKLL